MYELFFWLLVLLEARLPVHPNPKANHDHALSEEIEERWRLGRPFYGTRV